MGSVGQRRDRSRRLAVRLGVHACVLTVTGVFVALVAGACASAPGPTATPTIGAEEVRDRAADGLRGLSTVHFRVTHEEGGTDIGFSSTLTEAEGDGVFPDKASFVAKATSALFGDAALELDIVQDGETTYLRDRISMAWQTLPPGTLAINFGDINGSIADALASVTDPTVEDGGSMGDAPVYLLTGVAEAAALRGFIRNPAAGATLDVEVWIGRDDYLVRKGAPDRQAARG